MDINQLKRMIDHAGVYRDNRLPTLVLESRIEEQLKRLIIGDEVRVQGQHYRAVYDGKLRFERVK